MGTLLLPSNVTGKILLGRLQSAKSPLYRTMLNVQSYINIDHSHKRMEVTQQAIFVFSIICQRGRSRAKFKGRHGGGQQTKFAINHLLKYVAVER